jgi:hypothetical protein
VSITLDYLEMADGGYCRALLYLLDHSISAELPELLGGWDFVRVVLRVEPCQVSQALGVSAGYEL